MRSVVVLGSALLLTLAGCSSSASTGDDAATVGSTTAAHSAPAHSHAPWHPSSSASRTTHKRPAVMKRCSSHPLDKPASVGTPLCGRFAVLEVLDVKYDIPDHLIKGRYPYRKQPNATWVSVKFRATWPHLAPSVSTSQLAPTLTDRGGRLAMGAGLVEDKTVPFMGSTEFRVEWSYNKTEAAWRDLVVCEDFLSSSGKSPGCGLLK